jgi:ethanolamine ammonia-lyase small subunit
MKSLAAYTPARVSLGVAGGSLPTKPLLDLRLAQARARDAVHVPLDSISLSRELALRAWPSRTLASRAADRIRYLRRPDEGRLLDAPSSKAVATLATSPRLVFILADGLSALAIHRQAVPLVEQLFRRLPHAPDEANPIWIVQQARVAVGDHIGELLGASLSVVLIGERPGLSSPDSLGVYLTWQPRRGRTDAERNCVSNIHPQGLSAEVSAHKVAFLINEAFRLQLSGVGLKENAVRLLGDA